MAASSRIDKGTELIISAPKARHLPILRPQWGSTSFDSMAASSMIDRGDRTRAGHNLWSVRRRRDTYWPGGHSGDLPASIVWRMLRHVAGATPLVYNKDESNRKIWEERNKEIERKLVKREKDRQTDRDREKGPQVFWSRDIKRAVFIYLFIFVFSGILIQSYFLWWFI